MKRIAWMAIGALLLLVGGTAGAQSLGEVARSARKGKTQQSAANHKYDNDNLPKQDHLSVVGPAPVDSGSSGSGTGFAGNAPADGQAQNDPKAAAETRQKDADEWKKRVDEKQKRVDDLARELDLTQREYKLRAAAMYADAGSRLRNAAAWDKEDADYKKQIDSKQKDLDTAKQELDQVKEEARKSGAPAGKE